MRRCRTTLVFASLLAGLATMIMFEPTAAGAPAVTIRIDQYVRHPETQDLVRIGEARAIVSINPNSKDSAFVDLTVLVEAIATVPDASQTYRLRGAARSTLKKAAGPEPRYPIICELHFVLEKQTGPVPALVLMGDVVEIPHGEKVILLRRIVVPPAE